jgi:dihydrolipoamide dehydrogenase
MAANDGPVPVRTLAHAARLMRDAAQLGAYGIDVDRPRLDYARLLERVHAVVADVREDAALRAQLDRARVTVFDHVGVARFVDAHTIETSSGLRLHADRFVLCTGGTSRTLPVPGFELTATHSDAWSLTSVPRSMLIVGAGATGAQVASIFNGFGTRIELFEAGERIVGTEDEDVSEALAASFRAGGIVIHERFGSILSFERTSSGDVRMSYASDGVLQYATAALAVIAVGWVARTSELDLAVAGVELTERGFVRVDAHQRTSAPHVFAAGDVTGRMMLVPQALQAGFVAATNAVKGGETTLENTVEPIGSFTNPEYAQAGLTEAKAREAHDVVVVRIPFDVMTRAIIDGQTFGFCKLVIDRRTHAILGCHVVGDRAVDIVQTAAVAIAANMRVDDLARLPFSFPTYTSILGRAALAATHALEVRT